MTSQLPPHALPPKRRWFSRRILLQAVFLGLTFLTPAGREWMLFIVSGGKWHTPNGWPELGGEDWQKPTDPRELEAYHYAHSLKLPESLPKPVPFNFARHLQEHDMARLRESS